MLVDNDQGKLDATKRALESGSILVHLDTRCVGVDVPNTSDEYLVLRFGYDLSPEIPDLVVDEFGISGTLKFAEHYHHCKIPWLAIHAVVQEVMLEFPEQPYENKRSHLRLVE